MASEQREMGSIPHLMLRVVPRLSRFMERELLLAGVSLSLRQLRVLQRLHDGEQIAAEIARQSSVGPAAMQGVLDALVERGLVLRERSAVDRRKQILRATAAGDHALAAGNAILTGLLGELVDGLSPEELDTIASGLELLREATDRFSARLRARRQPASTHQ